MRHVYIVIFIEKSTQTFIVEYFSFLPLIWNAKSVFQFHQFTPLGTMIAMLNFEDLHFRATRIFKTKEKDEHNRPSFPKT